MEISYQRDLNQNYMILPLDEAKEETYERRMVSDNHIAGLLPMDIRAINGEQFYYYDIHSLQSIRMIFEHQLFDKETLMQLFCGISRIFKELRKYLLSPENLFLKPESVYMNIETGEVFLCFFPQRNTGKETFEELAEFLIDRVNHGEDEAKELAYAYYENVCAGRYDPENLIERTVKNETEETILSSFAPAYEEKERKEEFYFVEHEEETVETGNKISVLKTAFCMGIILLTAGMYFLLLSHPEMLSIVGLSQEDYILIGAAAAVCSVISMIAVVRCIGKEKQPAEQESKCPVQEFRTDGLEEEIENREEYMGETTVLTVQESYNVPQLKGMDGDEERRFILDDNPFIIGKLSGKVNGILTDSRVSRVHAVIREDSGYYYISDLNSRNGTYVNGNRINGTESVRLRHLDRICMASVEMVFLCQ